MALPWHRRARCAQPDIDYSDYDCEIARNAPEKCRQIVRAVEACEGCPVVAACAQWALDEHAIGVVAAGVALPLAPWWTPSSSSGARRALERIVCGGSMHNAVAIEMCVGKYMELCQRVVIARELECGRGAVPPPTPSHLFDGCARV